MIAEQVVDDLDVQRLLTIPGIDVVTASTLVPVAKVDVGSLQSLNHPARSADCPSAHRRAKR